MSALEELVTKEFTRAIPVLLIVDDEEGIRESLKQIFKIEYEIILCGSAEEALEKYRIVAPDAAIIDLRLGSFQGIDLIRELNSVDPLVGKVIYTAYGQLETAIEAIPLGVSAYVDKMNTDELKKGVAEAVRETEKRRRNFLYEFGTHYARHVRKIEDPGRTKPVEVDGDFGQWLKTVRDRIPFKHARAFTYDATEGVVPVGIPDLEKEYPPHLRLYDVKRHPSLNEFESTVDNWRLFKANGINHAEPTLYYKDGEQVYALHRIIFAPNFVYIFDRLNSAEDQVSATKLRLAMVKTNAEKLARYQNIAPNTIGIEDIKASYLRKLKESLHHLREKGYEIRDSEIDSFLISLDGLKALTPYLHKEENDLLFSKRLDNKPANSGLELGSLRPSLERILGLAEGKDEEAILESVRGCITYFESVPRFFQYGPCIEEFINFAHSPQANLNQQQKISIFIYYVNQKFKVSDIGRDELWMAYAITGMYKAIERQDFLSRVLAQKDEQDRNSLKITNEEHRERVEDLSSKLKYWRKEAAWFATMAYLIAEQTEKEKGGFSDIKRLLMQSNIFEDTQARLDDKDKIAITNSSPTTDKMLYAYKFYRKCCAPNLNPASL